VDKKPFRVGNKVYHINRKIFATVCEIPVGDEEYQLEEGIIPCIPETYEDTHQYIRLWRRYESKFLISVDPDTPQNRLAIQIKYSDKVLN
jgi:hypothetical protein